MHSLSLSSLGKGQQHPAARTISRIRLTFVRGLDVLGLGRDNDAKVGLAVVKVEARPVGQGKLISFEGRREPGREGAGGRGPAGPITSGPLLLRRRRLGRESASGRAANGLLLLMLLPLHRDHLVGQTGHGRRLRLVCAERRRRIVIIILNGLITGARPPVGSASAPSICIKRAPGPE